jgi:two-component system, LytTR family, sensor kinase
MALKTRTLWILYALAMLLLGGYNALNQVIDLSAVPSIAPWKPVVWEMTSACVIAGLIPAVMAFENRFRIDGRPRARMVVVHLLGGVVFSVVHTGAMVLLRKVIYGLAGETYFFGNTFLRGFYELQKDLITYAIVLVVIFAAREFRIRRAGEVRAVELAAQLSEARLHYLTTQLEPHFLFNSLNAISNRMHEDVSAADRMISQLGDLLRAAYETDRQVLVPLERELGWLRGYAAMMAERFRGQLSFQIDVEPGLERTQVPRLLLQPLVENAVRHGLREGHGWLQVDVRRNGRRLQYTVSDDGTGLPETPVAPGTGLSNISRRLELLFPGDYTFDLAARVPRGAVVTIEFPVAA